MKEVTSKRSILEMKYDVLLNIMGIQESIRYSSLNFYIKEILGGFIHNHKRVAIYCYGYHTQMLFADFVAELRDIVCIIDNGKGKDDSDFEIIKDSDIEKYELDGVIISSYKYMSQIKKELYKNHELVDVLDIYEELGKRGIILEHEFFYAGPYQIYSRINTLHLRLRRVESIDLLKQLLREYVGIKDFRLAGELSRKIYELTGDENDKKICEKIIDLYEMELKELSCTSENNILMLCLDGMRRDDFFNGKMRKTYAMLKNSSYIYSNAYSYSTMTYETLVPVFEENSDQRTNYYLREEVLAENCRFIKKAIAENRFVSIYGDGNHYIYDNYIKYSGNSQTITEKLWDFILDTEGVEDGIFYLHELYESHYSFANPYTKEKMVSQGSAMLFDFLPQNSGHLRTDYKSQQEDALKYLDDTLAPFLEVLPCNLLLFADHGNLLLEENTEVKDIFNSQLVAGEEWIRIPLIIKSNHSECGEDSGLISLMSINDIMLAIMSGKEYEHNPTEYIKIGRSGIYNQQFKELYRLMATGYNGEAFEGFIFKDGYKLIIFSDGRKELYRICDDFLVKDQIKTDELFEKVKTEVTIF